MASEKAAADPLEESTDLGGMFYPVGYIFAAFPQLAQAREVQRALVQGGLGESDCRLYTSEHLANVAHRELEQNTGWLATLGRSNEAVQRALDAAEEGASFLLIHAPGDAEAAHVMEVVRRVPFKFAHRYHRLAIEILR